MECDTDSTSIVTSFDASVTGDELDSAVQLPNFRSVVALRAACSMHDAIYSARLALHVFIHGIMSAKRTREVRPVVLIGESSTQLLMGYRHQILYILTDFQVSIEALNFLIIAS